MKKSLFKLYILCKVLFIIFCRSLLIICLTLYFICLEVINEKARKFTRKIRAYLDGGEEFRTGFCARAPVGILYTAILFGVAIFKNTTVNVTSIIDNSLKPPFTAFTFISIPMLVIIVYIIIHSKTTKKHDYNKTVPAFCNRAYQKLLKPWHSDLINVFMYLSGVYFTCLSFAILAFGIDMYLGTPTSGKEVYISSITLILLVGASLLYQNYYSKLNQEPGVNSENRTDGNDSFPPQG